MKNTSTLSAVILLNQHHLGFQVDPPSHVATLTAPSVRVSAGGISWTQNCHHFYTSSHEEASYTPSKGSLQQAQG